MAEKIIGFSIQVKGSDSEVGKLQEMKGELSALEKQFANYTNKSSVHALALQAKIKGLTSDVRTQEKAIIENGKAVQHAAGSYNALVAENKKLSAELRSLPIDQTNAKFKQLQTQLLNNTDKLKSFDKSIGRNFREVGNYGNAISQLKGGLGQLAGAFGVTFAAAQVVDFGKEAVRLSLQAEGVERAFKKLNNPQILDQLKIATKGTVSDLELMKAAVKAENFKIPLDLMAKGLQFAQQRAQDTGESVDYLVESFVKGLGRESALIIDNLGISQVELNKEIEKTSDFTQAVSNIMTKELGLVGVQAETTAQKLGKITAFWENLKVTVGDYLVNAGSSLLDYFDVLTGKTDIGAATIQQYINVLDKRSEQYYDNKIISARKSEDERLKIVVETEKEILKIAEQGVKAQDLGAKQLFAFRLKKEQDLLESLKNLNVETQRELTKEELEEIKKRNDEKLKANQDLIRKIQDLQVQNIKDDEERERAELQKKYSRDVIDTEKTVADVNNKNAVIRELAIKFENDMLALALKYRQLQTQKNKEENDRSFEEQGRFYDDLFGIREALYESNKGLDEKEAKERLDAEKENAKRLKELKEQNVRDLISGAYEISKQLSDTLFQLEREQYARQIEQRQTELDARQDIETTALKNRLDKGIITEAQYMADQETLNKKHQEEDLKIKKEAFEKEKKLKSQQIGIELAIELARIAANAAANPTNATTFGAAGLAQIAIQSGLAITRSGIQLAAVQNAEFEQGGILKGKSHKEGGIPFAVNGQLGFEAEGGEAIINKRSTSMFGDLLSMINQAGGGKAFERGGVIPAPSIATASSPQSLMNFGNLANDIIRGINDKKVYQLESEVRGVLTRVGQIESESRF